MREIRTATVDQYAQIELLDQIDKQNGYCRQKQIILRLSLDRSHFQVIKRISLTVNRQRFTNDTVILDVIALVLVLNSPARIGGGSRRATQNGFLGRTLTELQLDADSAARPARRGAVQLFLGFARRLNSFFNNSVEADRRWRHRHSLPSMRMRTGRAHICTRRDALRVPMRKSRNRRRHARRRGSSRGGLAPEACPPAYRDVADFCPGNEGIRSNM
ncbi:hypothetical protein EVAR_77107_1 [Eumeta japonica]|uniref:Uncharacterized protein n=1 Tax=Eumeta variegata TaxID=151549 RepID=A0A4C1T1Q6_EUMVA|nr:hypothetical protein EVAR_77107_1 [Eumeta japonica]